MTREELDKLFEARQYIVDATLGPCSIKWHNEIIEKLKSHKEHGTPSISCTVDFLKLSVMIDADILIKIFEDRVSKMEAEVKRCDEMLSHATL